MNSIMKFEPTALLFSSINIRSYTNFWKEEVKTSFWVLSGDIIWDLIGYKTLECIEFVFFVILGIDRRVSSKWT